MDTKVPNLELLIYKAKAVLFNDAVLNQKLANIGLPKDCTDFEVDCFMQTWGSTCTGFDETKEGVPTMSGSAVTREYTTVVREMNTNIYCVYFGDRLCYIVNNPNNIFFRDLRMRRMKSLSESKKYY